jgi:hypothetical protein
VRPPFWAAIPLGCREEAAFWALREAAATDRRGPVRACGQAAKPAFAPFQSGWRPRFCDHSPQFGRSSGRTGRSPIPARSPSPGRSAGNCAGRLAKAPPAAAPPAIPRKFPTSPALGCTRLRPFPTPQDASAFVTAAPRLPNVWPVGWKAWKVDSRCSAANCDTSFTEAAGPGSQKTN